MSIQWNPQKANAPRLERKMPLLGHMGWQNKGKMGLSLNFHK